MLPKSNVIKDLSHNPLFTKPSDHGHLVSIFSPRLFHRQELQEQISTGRKLSKNKGEKEQLLVESKSGIPQEGLAKSTGVMRTL